jgi:hypothetical protein
VDLVEGFSSDGSRAVFLCGFMLPLTMSKAMETHLNRTFGIMTVGIVVFVGMLYYLFAKYPVKPREQAAPLSSTDSTADIN